MKDLPTGVLVSVFSKSLVNPFELSSLLRIPIPFFFLYCLIIVSDFVFLKIWLAIDHSHIYISKVDM